MKINFINKTELIDLILDRMNENNGEIDFDLRELLTIISYEI